MQQITKWTIITNEQALLLVADAEENWGPVIFSAPPENRGQIVEEEYAGLGAEGIICRTTDRGNGSRSYLLRAWIDDDEDRPGLNHTPA